MLTIFKNENGLFGAHDNEGNESIPCIYDEITMMNESYFCRIWKDCDWYSLEGISKGGKRCCRDWITQYGTKTVNESIYNHIDDRKGLNNVPLKDDNGIYIIYKEGKFGAKDAQKKNLLPCIFDDIYRWKDCDVIETRIGIKTTYFNLRGEVILSKARYMPFEATLVPYTVGEQQNDIALMTMEFVDHLYDEQCCICYGRPTRLDRVLRQKIEGYLRANCEIKQFSEDTFYLFNGCYTYIYRAYIAHSKEKNPIGECVHQLHEMRCYSSSWYYIDKVWTNEKTKLSEDELELLQIAANDCNFGGHTIIAYGIDDTLADGEAKVFHIEYFADHWPDEGKYYGEDDEYFSKYLNPDNHDWKEIEEKLEKVPANSDSFGLISNLTFNLVYEPEMKASMFCYNAIKWGLKQGWSPNEPLLGKNSMDFLEDAFFYATENPTRYAQTKLLLLKKTKRLLLKYGGKVLKEYRKMNLYYNSDDFIKYD